MNQSQTLKKDWLTAAELTVLRLRGLPSSKRRINEVIKRQGWSARGPKLVRRRKGKGGGLEYHINNLPAASRHHLAIERHKAYMPDEVEVITPQTEPPEFTQHQSLRRDARLELLAAFNIFHLASDLPLRTAEFEFARAYNAGAAKVPGWVRAEIKTVSAPSLQRWRKLRATGKFHDLGGKYKHVRRGILSTAHNGDIERFIGALIIKQPHLTADHIRDITADRFGPQLTMPDGSLRNLPPIRTFQRFIANWKEEHRVALLKITNPDKYKSAVRFSGTNMNAHVERLNQLWEIDASPADVLTKQGRRNLYAVVDIWSRRMIVQVTDRPRTQAMLSLLRRAIIAWGVPEVVRVDNGSDFVSQEAKRAFNSLGIIRDETAAFSPEQKGTVERHIRTVQHGCMPLLPGFVGHNVAQRKVIEERTAFAKRLKQDDYSTFEVDLSHDELQDYIDRWVTAKYEQRVHGGLCDEAPFTKAASYTGKITRIDNIRALDLLLSPISGKHGHRTVTKYGVRLDGATFMSGALTPGEKVFIRHDPEDMGRIFCFEAGDGAFICEAECPKRLGLDPKAMIAAVRREQARRNNQEVKPLQREINNLKKRDLIEAVLRTNEAVTDNLAAFPNRSEAGTSEQIDAAIEAVSKPQGGQPLTSEELAAAEHYKAKIGLKESAKVINLHAEPSGDRKNTNTPDLSDDLGFYTWALANPDRLTPIQKSYLDELKNSQSFQYRVKVMGG